MANRSGNSVWILVVILAVCLQVAFVFADCKQTATGTAVDFSRAYFLLDPDMEKYMCSDLAGDADESAAATYLLTMTDEARERGFGTGMVRQTIYHVKTETLAQDAESATIHLKGYSRTCIHPVFAYVAKLFQLGRTNTFEGTLDLIKEDGKWKVCGAPYGLSPEV
ncbi:hypothetical protein DSCA_46380 [Desulfosarcina alkanivorans]|uniref:SnoaL-like domain-containing protein n=1 Tax=Desulfosarcina alkanivorans TaxID=571177 RepID=A0A5K7YPR6_9BACT|nr:hypothetical protein [Desulfosarcina alkanivorans]BBO70708.1 hypothetical protein DSCA_46380 [Desulfosarcina alkanivorans]